MALLRLDVVVVRVGALIQRVPLLVVLAVPEMPGLWTVRKKFSEVAPDRVRFIAVRFANGLVVPIAPATVLLPMTTDSLAVSDPLKVAAPVVVSVEDSVVAPVIASVPVPMILADTFRLPVI